MHIYKTTCHELSDEFTAFWTVTLLFFLAARDTH